MNLKKLLPYENFVFSTHLSMADVQRRLEDNIEPSPTGLKSFLKLRTEKPYKGYVQDDAFEIERIIHYRNSFLPKIKGEIKRDFGKTEIHIKMKMHLSVYIFMALWLVIVGLFFLLALPSLVHGDIESFDGAPGFFRFHPLFMLLFGLVIFYVPFKWEASKSKKFLANLLEAEAPKSS